MAGAKIALSSTTGELKNDGQGNALVTMPTNSATGAPVGGGVGNAAAVVMLSENDAGSYSGVREIYAPETDTDYRLRISQDQPLDYEMFNYASQNTGKHTTTFTTMTPTMQVAGLYTNSTSNVTTTIGMTFGTHAQFPCGGSPQITACEMTIAFTAQSNANTFIDFGLFQRGASTAFAPLDGVFFRNSPTGLLGVVSRSGSESTVQLKQTQGGANLAYTNSAVNRYLIQVSNTLVTFWFNNFKVGEIVPSSSASGFFTSQALPWSIRHANVGGAAGTGTNCIVYDYKVLYRGNNIVDSLGVVENRVLGSYQGLSGGTMGSLASYANSANPTAAAPSNTALTANLPAGLGGQGAVTAAAAAATDGIWSSVQIPAGSTTVQGRRLRINSIIVDAVNMGAAVATTATTIQFSLAFGSTGVSLATGDSITMTSATTKAPRRLPLGIMNWPIAAPIGAMPDKGKIEVRLLNPIFVNPGEFVQLVGKFLNGTATASQVINFVYTLDYSWE